MKKWIIIGSLLLVLCSNFLFGCTQKNTDDVSSNSVTESVVEDSDDDSSESEYGFEAADKIIHKYKANMDKLATLGELIKNECEYNSTYQIQYTGDGLIAKRAGSKSKRLSNQVFKAYEDLFNIIGMPSIYSEFVAVCNKDSIELYFDYVVLDGYDIDTYSTVYVTYVSDDSLPHGYDESIGLSSCTDEYKAVGDGLYYSTIGMV